MGAHFLYAPPVRDPKMRTSDAALPPDGPPHHNRTRPSGEQRGTTLKATEPDEASTKPFTQFSAPTAHKCPQLPKLRA